jgi:BirA family biotin operon repressor/biotin-[acetyl-CoA-carboxylase] ligase
LTDPSPPENWPQLALVAALSVHDAIVELASKLKPRLSIKWPNDLLVDQAKFAGVLIEGEAGEAGAVAIGIGVNCTSHPSETDFPATDLAHAGAEIPREVLFAELSAKLVGRLAQWNRGEHFATIRTDWLARAAGLGGRVRLRLPDREVVGQFETIDDGGRLLLLISDDARQSFAAGDIVQLLPTDQFSEP